ncbi:MAG: Hpt domain-containing protein, partial [Thermoanaerobacteraceae bacterium]
MENNQYIDIFIEETQEHLENLNSNLLLLEKDTDNIKVIDEIFRSAHTLKGMAATMGFESMTKVAHKMEDILHDVKNNKLKINSRIMDVIFKCVDTLGEMLDSIAQNGNDDVDIQELMYILTNFNSNESEAGQYEEKSLADDNNDINIYEEDIIEEALKNNYNVYKITVFIDKGCIMKSARAFIIFNTLDEMGDVIKSLPTVEDIEDEKFGDN